MENLNIIHEPEKQRFILTIQDETAHVRYRIENGAFDTLRHTIGSCSAWRKGIASALVKEAYDYARGQGYQIVATCAYAVRWHNVIPNMKENPVMNIVQEMRVLCNAALPAGSPVIE